ncbi:unnamed protein product [Tetraodon nigroviridis]|uniref:(spotted green pufferfish) hypothetical protein n=1 Tax=Tetraodon nigroviridis TaxID=99883 RepID=Q4SLM5_TETNG|nr:unnamed protein product [Tetraodon nigroviridis]
MGAGALRTAPWSSAANASSALEANRVQSSLVQVVPAQRPPPPPHAETSPIT